MPQIEQFTSIQYKNIERTYNYKNMRYSNSVNAITKVVPRK